MTLARTANCAARPATCFSPKSGRSMRFSVKASQWKVAAARSKAAARRKSWPSCRSKSLAPRGTSSAVRRLCRRHPKPMNSHSGALIITALFCAAPLLAQKRASTPAPQPATRAARGAPSGPKTVGDYSSDIIVVRDAQEQALEQVRSLQERVEDPHTQASLESAVKGMERSLAILEEAKHSPEKLAAALAAEQPAYQALLKLAAREYQVSRSRNQQGGGQQGERAERQLDELELKQSDNRYETQRQASPQQHAEQREPLQVLNRHKELAQGQQDLNERLKELQTALQEAKTEGEREEIRRRLKRLREEEQEMLADVDELRQRMERPENQSRMADA